MKLYLVRHGDALSAQTDPDRPLSPHGKDEVGRVAQHLRNLNVQVCEIRHSTKERAKQTAQIISAQIGCLTNIRQIQGLAPNDPVEPIAKALASQSDDLMLVGHLPFMSILADRLLAESDQKQTISFPAGGVAILSRDPVGVWSLEEQIWPERL